MKLTNLFRYEEKFIVDLIDARFVAKKTNSLQVSTTVFEMVWEKADVYSRRFKQTIKVQAVRKKKSHDFQKLATQNVAAWLAAKRNVAIFMQVWVTSPQQLWPSEKLTSIHNQKG